MSILLEVRRRASGGEGGKAVPNVQASWEISLQDLEFGELLGRGSFGTVHCGWYEGTEVAIKTIQRDAMADVEMRKFLERELAASKLSHPNLIGFIGVAENEDLTKVYLVTELLECNLREAIKDGDEISWAQRLGMALDAARGLAFLHAKRILHRDVKSKNLLLDQNKKVKLCDFGFARTFVPGEMSRMTICGTESYMAPEVILQEEYDNKADVFSYGLVLAELITGLKVSTAFERGPQDLFALQTEQVTDNLLAGCPPAFAQLCLDCCAFEPADRPEFRDVINRILRLLDQLFPEVTRSPRRPSRGPRPLAPSSLAK
mmetsp:Transcript_15325/g.59901  ORF Transcript_15325/g.59901 Transcript_15325/m.59901 type:complete len:318 (-) Transcript_15325:123-1076(-)|eukprot:CAMPEP_0114614224 /NCGR_PEP_ID=MMETSP0168-20121206/5538_1 /TAXON_ID=95228 ORGANISM="Vannella sp., Strain DIVA3 517/6/12" /NCGR_SAMPLE_ID=MMETSP0168 /ASSEMBLY_ACC=CAM_ASM_000044 /LENGTH=317 /DNA_ID=CAMNT_0001825255 /DNA_START=256 /DNA_END=1209 /DNA_ORIENTATION=+